MEWVVSYDSYFNDFIESSCMEKTRLSETDFLLALQSNVPVIPTFDNYEKRSGDDFCFE